ncbi:MAG: DUF523 domain-containing protein [Bdellovibrio sp.]|nr:DUF523 domain-containing protein [Bdellovibrio sp.]
MSEGKILVSACLIGRPCRYDGKHQLREEVTVLHEEGLTIAVCPEEMGGLSTPRTPAERIGDKVIDKNGVDVTAQYQEGANKALEVALKHGVKEALLKSKSPMCGCGRIYDGSFSGKTKDGNGVLAEKLLAAGIEVESID